MSTPLEARLVYPLHPRFREDSGTTIADKVEIAKQNNIDVIEDNSSGEFKYLELNASCSLENGRCGANTLREAYPEGGTLYHCGACPNPTLE